MIKGSKRKLKYKVDVDKVDEEYRSLVKPEMTNNEVAQLGVIIAKQKLSSIKNKWFGWYYKRKAKKQSKKEI